MDCSGTPISVFERRLSSSNPSLVPNILASKFVPKDTAVAKAVMINGAATKNHETGPNPILQNISRNTTVARPRMTLIASVTYNPKDTSNPTWMARKMRYNKAGGHKSSMKRIYIYLVKKQEMTDIVMELTGCGPLEAAKALAEHKEIWLAVDSLVNKPVISGDKYIKEKPMINTGLTKEQQERCQKGRELQEKVNGLFSVAHSQTRIQQDVEGCLSTSEQNWIQTEFVEPPSSEKPPQQDVHEKKTRPSPRYDLPLETSP